MRRQRIIGPSFPFLVTPIVSGGFSPTSAESTAFLTRATNVTLLADKQAYDALITGLVNDGLWSKLDLLYVWAAVDRTTALLNLKSASNPCAEHGTVNFTAYQGYTGDTSTFYLDTGFNPSAGGHQWAATSASMGAYILNDRESSGNANIIGWDNDGDGQQVTRIVPYNFTGLLLGMNGAGGGNFPPIGGGITSAQGFWGTTLTSPQVIEAFVWGTINSMAGSQGTDSTGSSPALATSNVTFFAYRSGGTQIQFSPDQGAAAFIGSYLTGTEMLAMARRLNTYMAAYGQSKYAQP
jgi:hypothetical protein